MNAEKTIGQASLTRILNYRQVGSVTVMIQRGTLPPADLIDWDTNTPRWYPETIARWLINKPRILSRVTDPEMLALVSEARGKMEEPT